MSTIPIQETAGTGFPAARVSDQDSHNGSIVLGSQNVFVEGMPLARIGDVVIPCVARITSGSPTVTVNGLLAARQTDTVNCGGVLVKGALKTFIGNGNGKTGKIRDCLKGAAEAGAATVSW